MLDWRDRFRAESTRDVHIAAENESRGVVVSNREGSLAAHAWDVETGSLRKIASENAATLEAAISDDGSEIYVLMEHVPGTEMGHIHAVPFEGGAASDLTPDLPPYPVVSLGSTGGFVHALVGIEGGMAVLTVFGGDVTLTAIEGLPSAAHFDAGSGWLAIVEAPVGGGFVPDTRVVDVATGNTVGALERATAGTIADGVIGVAISDGEWMRPAKWVPGSEPEPISVDVPGDVVPMAWSSDRTWLVLRQDHRSRTALFAHHLESGATDRLAAPSGAIFQFGGVDVLDDGSVLSIWSDAFTPFRPILSTVDGYREAFISPPKVYPGAEWEEVEYPSTDGAIVQGWLLRPPGEGPHTTVIYTHGGPTAVHQPTFNRMCQGWCDQGYAVLSVNYRGSTTFGERYREALTHNIGGPDVDDVVAAHGWLVGEGIADPRRVIKTGWSYGGYLTLQSLGTHPDLWAGGVAGAPVADYTMEYEHLNDVLRTYSRLLFGGPPDEFPEEYREASPLTHVDAVAAPLYISQPENDTRTPLPPVEAYVDALRRRGHRVEFDLLPGGHAGSGVEDEIAMFERWLAFVADVVE